MILATKMNGIKWRSQLWHCIHFLFIKPHKWLYGKKQLCRRYWHKCIKKSIYTNVFYKRNRRQTEQLEKMMKIRKKNHHIFNCLHALCLITIVVHILVCDFVLCFSHKIRWCCEWLFYILAFTCQSLILSHKYSHFECNLLLFQILAKRFLTPIFLST